MKNVSKFDKATLKALRDEMQAVLDKFGANLDFEVGSMRFSDAEVDIKVKAKVKGAVTMTDNILKSAAAANGITNFVNSRGDKLDGYNSRSYKYPFIYTCGSTGKRYKCNAVQAKAKFS